MFGTFFCEKPSQSVSLCFLCSTMARNNNFHPVAGLVVVSARLSGPFRAQKGQKMLKMAIFCIKPLKFEANSIRKQSTGHVSLVNTIV